MLDFIIDIIFTIADFFIDTVINKLTKKSTKAKGLAQNKSGWTLLEYLYIDEKNISKYENVTGAYAILKIDNKYLIGYNAWRKQWEFPAGGIEEGETARQAAARELFEETHQNNSDLEFKGLFKVKDAKGTIKYQAVFVGTQKELQTFEHQDNDEMDKLYLWDMKEDIGYVDECDVKIAEMICGN